MNGNHCLLDTNVVVAILNQETLLQTRLTGTIVYISCIVLGELYFGAYKSARVEDNLARIGSFIAQYPVLSCDKATAAQYGQIKQQLGAKGHPIPENDIWIAAMTMQHNLTLVTRDERFRRVDGLAVERW